MRIKKTGNHGIISKASDLSRLKGVFLFLMITLATLLFLRVLTVPALAGSDDDLYDEVYAADKSSDEYNSDDAASEDRIDVRLTRPDEGIDRIAEDSYALVPGAEKIITMTEMEDLKRKKSDQIKKYEERYAGSSSGGRSLASVTDSEGSSEELGDVVVPKKQQIHGNVRANVESRERAKGKTGASSLTEIEDIEESGDGQVKEGSDRYSVYPLNDELKPIKASQVQEVSMIVSDVGFFPNRVFVTQNIPVRMYLTTPSKSTLCFMVDKWSLKKGVAPGKIEEIQFMPDKVGDYRFYCPVKGIEGTITVRSPNGESENSTRGYTTVPVSRNLSGVPKGNTRVARGLEVAPMNPKEKLSEESQSSEQENTPARRGKPLEILD